MKEDSILLSHEHFFSIFTFRSTWIQKDSWDSIRRSTRKHELSQVSFLISLNVEAKSPVARGDIRWGHVNYVLVNYVLTGNWKEKWHVIFFLKVVFDITQPEAFGSYCDVNSCRQWNKSNDLKDASFIQCRQASSWSVNRERFYQLLKIHAEWGNFHRCSGQHSLGQKPLVVPNNSSNIVLVLMHYSSDVSQNMFHVTWEVVRSFLMKMFSILRWRTFCSENTIKLPFVAGASKVCSCSCHIISAASSKLVCGKSPTKLHTCTSLRRNFRAGRAFMWLLVNFPNETTS